MQQLQQSSPLFPPFPASSLAPATAPASATAAAMAAMPGLAAAAALAVVASVVAGAGAERAAVARAPNITASGYLPTGRGPDLFYSFYEAQHPPTDGPAPIVLWLQVRAPALALSHCGGPGR